jgi:hypothetical protein
MPPADGRVVAAWSAQAVPPAHGGFDQPGGLVVLGPRTEREELARRRRLFSSRGGDPGEPRVEGRDVQAPQRFQES